MRLRFVPVRFGQLGFKREIIGEIGIYSVCLLYLWGWQIHVREGIMKRKTKIIIWGFLGFMFLLGGGAIVYLAVIFYPAFNNPFNDLSFNREIWRSADGQNPRCPRGQMIYDLQTKYLSKGMTRDEVIRLLGKPDFESANQINYMIGFWTGFMKIDIDTFDLHFDRNNKLMSAQVVNH